MVVWSACVLVLAAGAQPSQTQTPSRAPSELIAQATQDALHEISRQAGVIFAGQVVAVRRYDGVNGATGVVEIDFVVDDAICGVAGNSFTLREWAGLWPMGDEPFRVGQRYLMLLHRPGPAGLSSPVGGADGAIPIRGGQPKEDAIPTLAEERKVDLRWIAMHGIRPTSYRPDSVARPIARPITVHPKAAVMEVGPGYESAVPIALAADATVTSQPQGEDYAAVLWMLRSWERVDHAAP
jgi:hypothetical protein